MPDRLSVYRFKCDVSRYRAAVFNGTDEDYAKWSNEYLAYAVHAQTSQRPSSPSITLDSDDADLAPLIGCFLGFGLFCVTPLADEELRSYLRTVAVLYETTIPGFAIADVTNVADCLDVASGTDDLGRPRAICLRSEHRACLGTVSDTRDPPQGGPAR